METVTKERRNQVGFYGHGGGGRHEVPEMDKEISNELKISTMFYPERFVWARQKHG